MEIKDTKGLLLHWWHYYGKCIYTLEELKEFEKIIDKYGTDKVLEAATASYICDDGSPTIILMSIRYNKVKELFDTLLDIEKFDEDVKNEYNAAKEEFLRIISSTIK